MKLATLLCLSSKSRFTQSVLSSSNNNNTFSKRFSNNNNNNNNICSSILMHSTRSAIKTGVISVVERVQYDQTLGNAWSTDGSTEYASVRNRPKCMQCDH